MLYSSLTFTNISIARSEQETAIMENDYIVLLESLTIEICDLYHPSVFIQWYHYYVPNVSENERLLVGYT